MHFQGYYRFFNIFLILSYLTGCPSSKNNSENTIEIIDEETATQSLEGIIQINLEIDKENGIGILELDNTPDSSRVECALNTSPIEKCEADKEIEFKLPKKDGVYTITAVAYAEDVLVAVGEKKFTIGKPLKAQKIHKAIPTDHEYLSDLDLEIDDDHHILGKPFRNGTFLKRDGTLELKVKFKSSPQCEPTIRCISGSSENSFSPICDSVSVHGATKKYANGTMPAGLQYLRFEANCGDKVGDPLHLYWYGVPESYTKMGVSIRKVESSSNTKYLLNLMKDDDCPQNLLAFECRKTSDDTFKACGNGRGKSNVIYDNQDYSQVRATCNATAYQAYTLE